MLDLDQIDEPIRDVIALMNKLGFRTTNSCAGYDYKGHGPLMFGGQKAARTPYVSFRSTLKAARMLSSDLLEIGGGWFVIVGHRRDFVLYFGFTFSNKDCKKSWTYLRAALVRYQRRLRRAKAMVRK